MHARLKNEFTEDEKCHNFMRWLKYGNGQKSVEVIAKERQNIIHTFEVSHSNQAFFIVILFIA